MAQAERLDEWRAEFTRGRGRFTELTAELERLLPTMFEQEGIRIAQLEARTKTVDSYCGKLERKNFKYDDPLREVTDLTALRVIGYYPGEAGQVSALLEREFDVDWDHSRRAEPADGEADRFGYRSDHYVLRLRPERTALAEWSRFDGLRFEVQVRTVMQHAWAAVDHRVRYKADDLPRDVRRRLFRLSALLELADEEFASIQAASEQARESYEASVARGDLDVTIDALSLHAYLADSATLADWTNAARRAGFMPAAVLVEDRLDALLDVLRAVGIRALGDLGAALQGARSWGPAALAFLAERAPLAAVGEDVISLLVLLHGGSPDAVGRSYFRDDIKLALLDALASGVAG